MSSSSNSGLSGPSDDSAYPQYIQDNAKKLGITAQQYQNIADALPGNVTGATYQLGGQGNQGWNQTVSSTSDRNTYDAVAQQVLINQALGSKQQTAPAAPSTVAQNPMNDITNLGAAALGEQAVYNPKPGPADPKSGIGTVTQPQITTNRAYAPLGPWSNTPGVFGKTGAPAPPPENAAALDTIGAKMTPAQFSDVANQIRGGSTNYVTVDGKPYTISQQNINHITSAFPGSQPSQFAQKAPIQTTPLTATPPPTAAQVTSPTLSTTPSPQISQATQALQQQLAQAPAAPGPTIQQAMPQSLGPAGPPGPPQQLAQQAMNQMPGYVQQAVQQAKAQMPAVQPPTGVPPGIARAASGINKQNA